MKFSVKKITPEITLYYSGQEPNQDLVKSISRIFEGLIEPFKGRPRHRVYLIEHNNNLYYAKKFLPKNLRDRFFQSRAERCYKISNQLSASGFKVVKPSFVLNYHKDFKHESVFVTEKTTGISIKDFFSSNVAQSEKEAVFQSLILTLGTFLKNNFFHNDSVLANFFIDPKQIPYKIIFLDFDSISRHLWISKKKAFHVLSMLHYSAYEFLVKFDQKAYSHDKVLHYLKLFLNSYNPKIKVDHAYNCIARETIRILKNKKKQHLIPSSSFVIKETSNVH